MDQAWLHHLHDIFQVNDGALSGIVISGLTDPEVVSVYNLVVGEGTVFPPDASFWDIASQSSRLIAGVRSAAEEVVAGRAEAFHHCLLGRAISGVTLPDLGVFVFPDSLDIDYRPGNNWGSKEIEALFELFRTVLILAPQADISLETEVCDAAKQSFRSALFQYLLANPVKG